MTTYPTTTTAGDLDGHVSERAGHPETRGIDLIPDSDRHGRPRQLFAVWAAPNVSYLSFAVGATLILMGLTLPQAVGVILAGNLLWIFTGIIAASGPVAYHERVGHLARVPRGRGQQGGARADRLADRRGLPRPELVGSRGRSASA